MVSGTLPEGSGEPHRSPCSLGAHWGKWWRQRVSQPYTVGHLGAQLPPLPARLPSHGWGWSGWVASAGEQRIITASPQPSLPGAPWLLNPGALGPWGAPELAVAGISEKVGPHCSNPHSEPVGDSPQAAAAAVICVKCRRGSEGAALNPIQEPEELLSISIP